MRGGCGFEVAAFSKMAAVRFFRCSFFESPLLARVKPFDAETLPFRDLTTNKNTGASK